MDLHYNLIRAVREGKVKWAKKLIDGFGLSYSESWAEGYNLLRDALQNEHRAVVKLLLTNGAKVNSKNSSNRSDAPLHFAVRNGDIEIVEMLLGNGASIDAKNGRGKTPLHTAIEYKNIEVARLLLVHGADVNTRDKCGKRPLNVAVEIESLPFVQLLLRYKAYMNNECTSRSKSCNTPLYMAVEKGCKEIVASLLSAGANANIEEEDSITPLYIAVKKGYTHIVEDLLNHGACIDSVTLKEGYTPLHFACELLYEEVVKLLLCKGADINASTRGNLTPLHIAIKSGCATVVKLLLKHGAEVDNQDEDGKTTLLLAVEKGDLTIVEDILKYRPDVNHHTNRSSLKKAVLGCKEIYSEIVKILEEYGLIVNPEDVKNLNLIYAAVEKGYMKIVENLLKYGADVNRLHNFEYKGFSLLHIAAKNKLAEVAELLVRYGADVNAKDKTGKPAIYNATENADLKMATVLLTNGAIVKDYPELLHIAVKKQSLEIVKVLLDHDVDINATDQCGRTPLHFIAVNERDAVIELCNFYRMSSNDDINIKVEIARLLLSKGANVDAQTIRAVTTLYAAICKRYTKVVEILLEYNANVNSKVSGVAPLHLSAERGNKKICYMLLNKGANVNDSDKDGMTALHIATLNGHLGVVKVLLQCGAEVDSKNETGFTPLHIASGRGLVEIVETLLEYGADINITSRTNRTSLGYATNYINSYHGAFTYDSDEERYLRRECVSYRNEVTAEILKCHIVNMKTANLC